MRFPHANKEGVYMKMIIMQFFYPRDHHGDT